jgi:ABC-type transporter lipoprotein component MlaA
MKTISQQAIDYQDKMNECADLETELWEEFNKKIWHINNEHRIKRQEMEKSYQN